MISSADHTQSNWSGNPDQPHTLNKKDKLKKPEKPEKPEKSDKPDKPIGAKIGLDPAREVDSDLHVVQEEDARPAITPATVIGHCLHGAGIGMLIGAFFSVTFSYVYHSRYYFPSPPRFVNRFSNQLDAVSVSFLLWILMGLIFVSANYFWNRTNWSLLKRTIVHCFYCYILFTILAIAAGWFPLNALWLIIYSCIWFAVYSVLWVVSIHTYRKNIKKVNERLQEESKNSTDFV